ncbi:MAG: PD-(D/E)XK nuclease family protein [Muribaculaceae bacterium]|nr:PD-(D/E)XK nuclease family protein [Muribaculaceae bacterium]
MRETFDLFSLIKFANEISVTKEKEDNQKRSFNLIQAVVRGKLHETSHSRILGELLRYDSEILRSFIDEFVCRGLYQGDGSAKVYIEKNNIDISIEGPGYTVVIENKVNNAPEQKAQIDRYVKQGKGEIYVLYLNGEYALLPSEYSFKETKDKCKIETKTFKTDFREWVNDLLNQDKSFSIHSALYHYKKYLDYMYDSNSGISNDIRTQVEEYLNKCDNNGDEIVALENLNKSLSEAAEICWSLRNKKIWEQIQVEINRRLSEQKCPSLVSLETKWDNPDAGIEFKIKEFPDRKFYAVVSYLRQRYIGIIDFNNNDKYDEKIVVKLKNLLSELQSDPVNLTEAKIYSTRRYPFWFNVDDNKKLENYYIELIKILKKKEEEAVIQFV